MARRVSRRKFAHLCLLLKEASAKSMCMKMFSPSDCAYHRYGEYTTIGGWHEHDGGHDTDTYNRITVRLNVCGADHASTDTHGEQQCHKK